MGVNHLKTWNDIERLLQDFPRVNTYSIYLDEEMTAAVETTNAPWGKEYEGSTSDEEIINDMYHRLTDVITTAPYMNIYVRVFPEISAYGGKKFSYFRILLVDKELLTA